MMKTAWKKQNGIRNFPAKNSETSELSPWPECPPGDLNIINSSLQSIGVKLVLYKMNHHDKGHMKL